MNKKVSVLLLEKLPGIGNAGDIVEVSEGYARNLLFPQGKAALATSEKQKSHQAQQKRDRQKAEEQLHVVQQRAESLTGSELTLTVRVKEGDEIYGSISAAHIAKELSKQTTYSIKAKDIALAEPLKRLGSYDIEVHLSAEIVAPIKVTVVAAREEAEPHEKA
jgi:large subunit ribosomal protein L9